MKLLSETLNEDKRVQEAKKILIEAVKDHQKNIQGIRPPTLEKKIPYQELLEELVERRGTPLALPYLGSGFGKGPFVELLDGSIKYDFITGIGVHYLGHSHEILINAALDAALSNTALQGNLQQNQDSLELMKMLTKLSGLDRCFLTTSGAMANENGLKIAFQHRFPANRVLAFSNGFCGRTLALSQITDKASFREGLPLNYSVDYLPFYDPNRHEESIEACIKKLKEYLQRYPKQHAVLIAELVQGEGGVYVGNKEFFQRIIELIKKEGILLLVDEVQSFGRLPEIFAFQYYQLDSFVDIATIGKLSQVCATLYKKELTPKVGLLSQTFTSSTAVIKVSQALINHLVSNNFYGENGLINQISSYFHEKLQVLANKYPSIIQGPFGIGAMVAFTVFKGDLKKTVNFIKKLFEDGVMTFYAGQIPTRVRLLIPVGVISKDDIDKAISIIEKCLINCNEE